MIRVLLVDDHLIVRCGLRALLEQHSDIEIVGDCDNNAQAIAEAKALTPDVILLNLLMPDANSLNTILTLKQELATVQIIILAAYEDEKYIFDALKAGAISYLHKSCCPLELMDAIRAAANGESKLHPRIAARMLHAIHYQMHTPFHVLTPREQEVLACIARGRSNQEIAVALSISEPTIRMHIANLLSKLHLSDRTQAAIYALQHHLIPLENALSVPQFAGQ